jgi:hypothetical protein
VEQWRPVVGYEPYYLVSDNGRIWSRRSSRRLRTPCYSDQRGSHPQVSLRDGHGKQRTWLVHQLVMSAFVGPCPPGMEILHGPLGNSVSSLENLSYGTRSQNVMDRVRDGTMVRGERHPFTKLTETKVRTIRARCAAGESHAAVARSYGISRPAVTLIVNRKRWGWLS